MKPDETYKSRPITYMTETEMQKLFDEGFARGFERGYYAALMSVLDKMKEAERRELN